MITTFLGGITGALKTTTISHILAHTQKTLNAKGAKGLKVLLVKSHVLRSFPLVNLCAIDIPFDFF